MSEPAAACAPTRHGLVTDVFRLGAPLLLAAVASSSSGLIDAAMMGHYGAGPLAAVAGASAIFDLLSSLVLASLVAHQILAARFAGAQNEEGVQASFANSLRWCGGFALVALLLCVVAGRPLSAIVSGGRSDLARLGAEYLAARAPTLPLLVIFGLLTATLNAHKITKYSLRSALLINVCNLALDLALIFGFGPLPRLGVVGNGLATSIAWALGVLYLVGAAKRSGFPLRTLATRRPFPETKFQTSTVRLAWPTLVSSAVDYASIVAFFAFIGAVGTTALAGGRLAFEANLFVFGLTSAFGAGGRILMGRAVGADDIGSVALGRQATRTALLAIVVPVALVLALLRNVVAGWLASSPGVADAAANALPLVGACIVVMAWTWGNVCLLRATGNTRKDMWANAGAAAIVQLPLAWVLIGPVGWGLSGAFVAVLCYWLARAVTTEIYARGVLREIAARNSRADGKQPDTCVRTTRPGRPTSPSVSRS